MAKLEIAKLEPLAKGGERAVYPDPSNSERLIKVLLPKEQQNKRKHFRAKLTRIFGQHRLFLLQQEYREYLRLILSNFEGDLRLPITHMYGFVETDLGMGCATDRVHSEENTPAPSWREVAKRENVEQRDIDALTDFCRRIYSMGVRCSDLTSSNVVLGYRTTGGAIGPYEAVLVDGFGDTHFVPIRSWSAWANRKAMTKRFVRLGKAAGLTWSPDERLFKR